MAETNSIDKYRITSTVMEYLVKKYGPFPLKETTARHRQGQLFTDRTVPRKWKGGKKIAPHTV